jgi:hypothetical protein
MHGSSSSSCTLAGYGGSGAGSRPTAMGSGGESQHQQGLISLFLLSTLLLAARAVCQKASSH